MISYVWEAVDESGNTTLFRRSVEMLPAILPDPGLSIGWNDGRLKLDWPAQPAGWWLESSSSLLKPDWKPVAITPELANDRYTVELTPTAPAQWFRLASGSPPLAIAPTGQATVVLTWPSLATGYVVERCSNPANSAWVQQPLPVVTTNGLNQGEVQATGIAGFFRLVRIEP